MASREYANANSRILLKLRYIFVWLSARDDIPGRWVKGEYSRVKFTRLSVAIISLINVAIIMVSSSFMTAHYGVAVWDVLEASIYMIIAIVFILGLRMWYAPCLLFFRISLMVNFMFNAAIIQSDFSRSMSEIMTLSWIYLIFSSIVLMRYDLGSKVNSLLKES